ncbi:hypothetical protein C8R45DRAFT_996433 [Mycena sanguinolenta]|nr:hypothetical protein C8R45DRAFT_996433 [Mycena sanguinolenta]
MSRPAVAGLLAASTTFTDAKHCAYGPSWIDLDSGYLVVLDKYYWMLYFRILVTAMFRKS